MALAAVVVALVPQASHAASSAYRCESIDPAAHGIGRFSVDPRSGAVMGAPLWPGSSWHAVLMSPGSSSGALKLMLRAPGTSPWFLVVDEDQPGPRKPFTLLGDDSVFVGFCE
jgi:hypothetical protein